jgi:hypothetical protein
MVARTRGWIKKYGKPNEETWESGGEGPTRNIGADITKIAAELRHAEEQIALAQAYPGRAVPVEPKEKSSLPTVYDGEPYIRVVR